MIAHNGGGIAIDSVHVYVFITANTIYDNGDPGITYSDNPDGDIESILEPPVILYFDLDAGLVSGNTCADCVVEIFSTENRDGKIFEGMVIADEYGNFTFNKRSALSGPFLTATTRSIEQQHQPIFNSHNRPLGYRNRTGCHPEPGTSLPDQSLMPGMTGGTGTAMVPALRMGS